MDLRTDLRLPDGRVIEVEVDTGSRNTILDRQLMSSCLPDGDERGARVEEGMDETGHTFLRRFAPIRGALALASAPDTAHERPTVMFQDIQLDGLLGSDFLDRFVQTYDTLRSSITLARPTG